MPNADAIRTDNPEVARMFMAHEVAKANALSLAGGVPRFESDAYLEVFTKVYRGTYAVISDPHNERGAKA